MRKESKKKIQLIFVLTLITGLLVCFRLTSGKQQCTPNFLGARKLIVVVVDFNSFFCPLCLESVRDFCDDLHSRGQDEFALGVLVYKSLDKKDDERFKKIIEKKLRGFVIGNSIKFPFILDHFHVFKGLNLEDAGIILLDRLRKIFKKYAFPLTNEQLEEIFSLKHEDDGEHGQ